MTPEQRRLRASLAAHEQWAKETDPTARTATAREASPASLTYFERQVDPEGILAPEERVRRAQHAKKAYYLRLALASSRARAAKKTGEAA